MKIRTRIEQKTTGMKMSKLQMMKRKMGFNQKHRVRTMLMEGLLKMMMLVIWMKMMMILEMIMKIKVMMMGTVNMTIHLTQKDQTPKKMTTSKMRMKTMTMVMVMRSRTTIEMKYTHYPKVMIMPIIHQIKKMKLK